MHPQLESDAREVLERFGMTAAQGTLCVLGGGFSDAVVVSANAAGRRWCIRRWPEPSPPPERLRELHRWLRFLSDTAAIPVAVPLAHDSADTLVLVSDRWWHVEPMLEGRADFHERPSTQRLRNAMARLAELHAASAEYLHGQLGAGWFRCGYGASSSIAGRLHALQTLTAGEIVDLSRRLQHCGAKGQLAASALAALTTLVPRAVTLLGQQRNMHTPLVPCLRDVWHDHVLFTGDQVTGIIDPSAARTESVAADLSRLVGSLVGENPELWRIALASYEAVRPLTPAERSLIAAFDVSGVVLSALHWVRRTAAAKDEVPPAAARRIDQFRDRLERMQHGAASETAVA
jgi:Ser/Thr protein kinase RdoA (MazF antagonist)